VIKVFGNIIGIEDNNVRIVNLLKKAEIGLINFHVVFILQDSKFVGVINNITTEYIDIILIGQIIDNHFIAGIVKNPKLESTCRIITKNELESLLGSQDFTSKNNLLIGNSVIYDNFKITVNKNAFLSNHFAILGNTGAGKSCSVARILQNIFYYNDEAVPTNAHFVIFDAYGEYNSALQDIKKIPGVNYKSYSCDVSATVTNLINIPPYFLGVDDLALLLGVDNPNMIPAIENTLRLVYIFTSNDNNIKIYQNNIIASSLQDILASGKPATQIRDQLIAVLTKYHTADLSLDSIISQPGYDRTLRQCLNIDSQGKINAMNLVVDFLNNFTKVDINTLDITKNFYYTLDDVYNALEFALINEGILTSNNTFDKLNSLKVRLRSIINSDLKKLFTVNERIGVADYVRNFFSMPDGSPCQIVDIDFDSLDERTSKIITKILSKLFFDYVTGLNIRATYPIHIIIEEAHRYVQNDTDVATIGYNIFERITKEGRKYGIILGLITQRASELSQTVLSQCSNFMVLRLYHPEDLDIVTSLSTNVTNNMAEKIKVLHPGMALCFGTAFKVPVLVQFELPNPMPLSNNVNITNLWYK
jgi:uncharacterized protein